MSIVKVSGFPIIALSASFRSIGKYTAISILPLHIPHALHRARGASPQANSPFRPKGGARGIQLRPMISGGALVRFPGFMSLFHSFPSSITRIYNIQVLNINRCSPRNEYGDQIFLFGNTNHSFEAVNI